MADPTHIWRYARRRADEDDTGEDGILTASPALIFAVSSLVVLAVFVLSSLYTAFGNFTESTAARTERAVEVLSAELDSALTHAEDVLSHLSRTIEIYGPGLVSEDLDPRMSMEAGDRSYLGLSVWSPFGDLLVTSDPDHESFDIRPLLDQFTMAEQQSNRTMSFQVPRSDGTNIMLLVRPLIEGDEFVGFAAIEVSLDHLQALVQRVQAGTIVPLRLRYDTQLIAGPRMTAEDAAYLDSRFVRPLQFGFTTEAVFRPADARHDALQSMRSLFLIAGLFGTALIIFAILLYQREIRLRRATVTAKHRSDSERVARKEAEVLLSGIQLLAAKESEEELYEGILSVISEVVPTDSAAIILQKDSFDVDVVASHIDSFDIEKMKFGSFIQRILSGEAFIINSFAEAEKKQLLPKDFPDHGSGLFTPLRAGQSHGCIVCLNGTENAFSPRHLAALNRFAPLASQVVKRAEEIRQLKKSVTLLDHVAHHDGLTGLANRKRFIETLSDQQCAHETGRFALLQLDLDRFKAINDSLGHAAGDYLLAVTGRRIAEAIRPNDFCARLGGDEFAIILNGLVDDAEIAAFAQRIIQDIQRPTTFEGRTLTPGTSIGISRFPADGKTAKSLMSAADMALFTAKADGRGRYAFFGGALRQEAERLNTIEAMIRDALEGDTLELFYQPICDLVTGEVQAYEALLRFGDRDGKFLDPKTIIEAAERARLMAALSQSILERALTDLSDWLRDVPGRRLGINLSASELVAPDLVGVLSEAVATYGLSPNCLELEMNQDITSERLLQNALINLHGLHRAGFQLAFNDFGTGYSSLKHLRDFAGHRLKLNQSMIAGIDRSAPDQGVIRSLVDLSGSLGLQTVAEGIETRAQKDTCLALGCDAGQGYFFSAPKSIDALWRDGGLARRTG